MWKKKSFIGTLKRGGGGKEGLEVVDMFLLENKLCLWNTTAPEMAFFLENCDLDIWP